uniref:E2 ubiquitin-conjugating enzyme n=1 Tax=Marseillevirus LCMAC201 TaxID=2506605 RepID=A0A481YVA8_9VIRU|nr:MAG: ubiquitin-conjugating enzyme E2 [Marseillevirus LCMAC201]
MSARLRRISKEIQQFRNDPPDYIYIDFNEEDLTHLEVLFIGPRYTPYSRIFMRFTVDFPTEYPIKAPKIVFTSSYNRKIHPNVFPGGWVCLSTLNTGDSSGWVPSINLTALLATIYSMFTKEMIMNDNTHAHEKSTDFFPGVMYDTFYINSKLLVDENNEQFKKIMMDYTNSHREWYIRKLERLSQEHDGKTLKNYYRARKANFKSLIPAFTVKIGKTDFE